MELFGNVAIAPAVEFGAVLALVLATLVALGFYYFWKATGSPLLQATARLFGALDVRVLGKPVTPFGALEDFFLWVDGKVVEGLWFLVQKSQDGVIFLLHQLASQARQFGHWLAANAATIEAAFNRIAFLLPEVGLVRFAIEAARRFTRDAPKILAAVSAATVALPRRIGALDEQVGRTARQARAHARRLSRLEKLLGVGAFAALTAVALRRLGLGWLRCPALTRIGRVHGCAPWRLLEYLLAPTVAILALTDVCALVKIIQRAALAAEPVLTAFVVTGEGFLCGGETNLASGLVPADRGGSRGYASGVLAGDLGR